MAGAQPESAETSNAQRPARPVPMDAVWQDNGPERATGEPSLVVDVHGFEGPLDLLLHLARDQKVDLTQISVLDLARQYLAFIEGAKALRIELAADYLVMAAWLAYLKSRLLVPQSERRNGRAVRRRNGGLAAVPAEAGWKRCARPPRG
jgi:segregation and condensation protein A